MEDEQPSIGADNRKDHKPAYTGKKIICPHCEGEVLVHFAVEICRIQSMPTAARPAKNREQLWRETLSSQQHSVLDAARRSGLLDCFEFALRAAPFPLPKIIDKHFLDWFKMCRVNRLPAWALNQFRQLYPGKLIEFYSHGPIGAVIAGHELSLFLPVALINGATIETPDGSKKTIVPEAVGVEQWIKTKMGYVPAGARVALASMRRKCIGDFAKPLL